MREICSTVLLLGMMLAAGAEEVDVTESITNRATWTRGNTYILRDRIFVEDGAELTIEPGVVVKGAEGAGQNAKALIVARGGKILAEGTAKKPIIFTSILDDVTDPEDLEQEERGLWGGVIILGKAGINTTAGEGRIEGIPSTEPRGVFGGTDDEDNSGVLRFVSIRYGGTNIGAGNEINGLTMGAVGSGTTIEYVEVFNNDDDGFEWFGGTVRCKYLVSAFCGDDAFDYDVGFRGRGQYWFAILRNDGDGEGDKAGEHDGGENPIDGTPYSVPVISNATYYGKGTASGGLVLIRDNAGGKYLNSIFTKFAGGIQIEKIGSAAEDSHKRLLAGDICIRNSLFWDCGTNDGWARTAQGQVTVVSPAHGDTAHLEDSLPAWGCRIVDPELEKMSALSALQPPGNYPMDPRPSEGSPAIRADFADPAVFDTTGYIDTTYFAGAFSPFEENWLKGWTALAQLGYVAESNGPITDERPEAIFIAFDPRLPDLIDRFRVVSRAGRARLIVPEGIANTIHIDIFTASGKLIRHAVYRPRQHGGNSVELGSGMPKASCSYVCRITAGSKQVVIPLTKVE